MIFKYTARTKQGELQTGNIDAANHESALNILSQHDLVVLEMRESSKETWFDRLGSYFGKIKQKDLVIFTRQFAVLLEARVPLTDGLNTTYKHTGSPKLREVIMGLASDVEAGLSLSQALEKYPQAFSEFYVNMVRSAEVTGKMNEVMVYLASYLEKELDLVQRIRNALIYPAVVVAMFVIVSVIMTTSVFPKIIPVFEEANVNLPIFSRILIAATKFLIDWWWAVLGAFAVLLVFVLDYIRTREGKAIFDQLILKIPVIGDMLIKLYTARMAKSISVLVAGGIPATQAVEITSHTINNALYGDFLHEIATRINAGELMSQAFGINSVYLPPILSQMISIGEKTGRLEETLNKVSEYYTNEVDVTVVRLVELIQPALILVIGILVGLLFAAILLPLYDLSSTI